MIPINMQAQPGTQKIILAESQPEYTPLPALYYPEAGYVLTEWEPTPEERAILAAGGVVRLWTWTFGQPFQPVALEVKREAERLPLEPVS